MLAHPGGDSAVVVDEERPSIGGYPHLPTWGQEALLCLVLGLGGAVGGRLGRLGVGERVLHSPPHLDVVGGLERTWKKRKKMQCNIFRAVRVKEEDEEKPQS